MWRRRLKTFVAYERALEQACADTIASCPYVGQKRQPYCGRGFIEAVTALVDLLGEFPRIGVRTDEPGVAMFPLVRYRYPIYYKVLDSGEVRIIRVRHASRKRP